MKHNKTLAISWLTLALLSTVAKGGNPELPLNLGSAGDFVVLAEAGISGSASVNVTGDIGVSPITATAITGFSLSMDPLLSGTFSISAQVIGKVYAEGYAAPTPAKMTLAISDMVTAYTQASLRTIPDKTEWEDGDISGLTITPGLYKWGTAVSINSDVWLDAGGNADAVFIFQIAEDLTIASGKKVILAGGAQAKNIFWQIAGGAGAILGTTAHIEGVVLTAKAITVNVGASFNGKLLAQSRVDLFASTTVMDSNLIPSPVSLEIISEHGIGNPTNGVYFHASGTPLTNSISHIETIPGGTQYVNTGWSMIGNSEALGLTNNMTMTLTNNAVLTWQWSTNYFLSLTATNGSILNASADWKPANSNYTLTVQADPGYTFDHWEMNGLTNGAGDPLWVSMTQAQSIVAVFRSLFVDISSNVDWNVSWVFNPRKGYFIGTLTLTNSSAFKVLKAPFWFQVANTTNYWLRYPTGINANTGIQYLDITAAVTNQLPGIGNGDQVLNVGESVTVTGIELMGRRTPDGLLLAVWADPPGMLAKPLDTDGDGMSDVDEYIAGTSAVDPASSFRIRLGPDGRSVQWDGKPNRIYTVLTSTNLSQGFAIEEGNIPSTGKPMTHPAVSRLSDPGTGETRFYRINVILK